jgi:hypothetical protein
MQDNTDPDEEEPTLTGLEHKIRALDQALIPDDLLARCLATIPADEQASTFPRVHSRAWKARAAVAAVALLLMGVLGCHRVVTVKGPQLNRTMETWFVHGKGGRQEIRSADGLTGVVVNNGRWEFRWDVPGHLVAAWSVSLIAKRSEFESAGLIQNSEALLRWAETHQAEIRIEPDIVDGRKVRKVTLRWPGPGGAGSSPQLDTVWFDPDSLRPVRQRSELWDGGVSEATFDYPAPENVPADLLAFQPPRDVTLEINDPDLGRQVYSEAHTAGIAPAPGKAKGAER